MLTGLFMERSMAMPGLYSQLSALTTGKSYKQKMAELQASALNIEKMLAEPTLNPKLRENLEKQFLDNLAKKEKLMKDHVENVDMMSDKEKENLVKIDSEIISYSSKNNRQFFGCTRAFSAVTSLFSNTEDDN